ncbi:hypothetical protein [Paraburkholderia sp. BL17N1]|uniref:hypothetical protein n=1 Tax=Paraburkholderia sp. BL17N1 TaxID=1938798 RepID=UPI0013159B1C|nr:hypothetical protein [Paraburkholderia sp. BL17N1]
MSNRNIFNMPLLAMRQLVVASTWTYAISSKQLSLQRLLFMVAAAVKRMLQSSNKRCALVYRKHLHWHQEISVWPQGDDYQHVMLTISTGRQSEQGPVRVQYVTRERADVDLK